MLAGVAVADPFEDGLAAYDDGDYATVPKQVGRSRLNNILDMYQVVDQSLTVTTKWIGADERSKFTMPSSCSEAILVARRDD